MPKLLKIGVDYINNYKVPNPEGGVAYEPRVMFYFDSDERTAKLVCGAGVSKGLRVDGSTVSRPIKVDKYKEFIHSAVFQRILSEFAKYDYVYDTNNLPKLEASAEQEIQNVLTDDASKKIYSANTTFIDAIIQAMEENMNDPNFMNYVNAVGGIQRVGDDVLSKVTMLSYKNTVMVLSQWVNAGNSGAPTFLATKRQWSLFFNRDVKPGATPLYAVGPKDTIHRSVKQTMADYGVSQADYDSNAMVRKQIDTLTNDTAFGQYINTAFGLVKPYYDYSQTELQAGAEETYDFEGKLEHNIDQDKSKEDDEKRGELLDAAIGTDRIDMNSVLQNIGDYANKMNLTALSYLVSKKNITRIVEFLANIAPTIDREVDAQKQTNYKKILISLVLKRLRTNVEYSDRLLANAISNLVPYYDRHSGRSMKLTKKAFHAIGSDFEDIINICFGLNESVSNNTIMWMLNQIGMSVEDYKNMPYDENAAESQLNDVKESFKKAYKKLIMP